jgi:hypothetical protein
MWLLIDNPDDALRFSWLDTDKITVEEVQPGKLWRVQFDYPCKQYGKLRPGYCETYPRNVLNSEQDPMVLANEREFCPLLDHLVEESMNHRGAAVKNSRAG